MVDGALQSLQDRYRAADDGTRWPISALAAVGAGSELELQTVLCVAMAVLCGRMLLLTIAAKWCSLRGQSG